ncbi:hypothetical protein MMC17_009886 [Xylographa soralifera]|nr:hypothetical protein [Xylographa soralifera]
MSMFSEEFDTLTGEELLEAEMDWNIRAVNPALPYLPDEVLLMIFEPLQKKSLKQVRLVCQRWSRLPMRLLFTRVFLSHYTKDLDVFSRITSNPEMSSSITELVYGTSKFITDVSLNSYACQLLAHPFAVNAVTDPDINLSNVDRQMNDFILSSQLPYANTKPEKAKSLAIIQKGHEAYKKASEEQIRNRKNGEATIRFCLSLKSLHRLRSIQFNHEWLTHSTLKHWKVRDSKSSGRCESPFVRSWPQFYMPPSSYLANLGFELSAIMTALALSLDCPTRLQSIKVPDIFLDCIATNQLACQDMSDVFRDLEVFELGTRDERNESKALQCRQTSLPRMLCSMPKLKILDLGVEKVIPEFYTGTPISYLCDLLGTPAPIFEHLTSLTITFVLCAQTELINFVSLHPFLLTLRLRGVELTEGDWASTIGDLRQHLRLRAFDLEWPILQKDAVELWSRWSVTGETVRQQLLAFVLHGGDNPLIDSSGKPIFTVEDAFGYSDDDELASNLSELFHTEDEFDFTWQGIDECYDAALEYY